jgi:hypothetical protein
MAYHGQGQALRLRSTVFELGNIVSTHEEIHRDHLQASQRVASYHLYEYSQLYCCVIYFGSGPYQGIRKVEVETVALRLAVGPASDSHQPALPRHRKM